MPFVKCPTCAAKLGSPVLCPSCLSNRATINRLENAQRQMREDFGQKNSASLSPLKTVWSGSTISSLTPCPVVATLTREAIMSNRFQKLNVIVLLAAYFMGLAIGGALGAVLVYWNMSCVG